MKEIVDKLKSLSDEKYRKFIINLTPNLDESVFLGVRAPLVKAYAKEIKKTELSKSFLSELPHKYYDENMLHANLLNEIKDIDVCLNEIDRFLPYVDNWATNDTIRCPILKKHKDKLLKYIDKWLKEGKEYQVRFSINMYMTYFLDEDFDVKYLEIAASIRREEYYIKMMIAWYFATALSKRWDETIPFIRDKRLDKWTHNKAIQKAIESYRITEDEKTYLRSLKI